MAHEHAPRRPGAVALDIGAGRGALVITTRPEHCGLEIEIAPVGDEAHRQHVWVLRRATPAGGEACAAVFSSLPQGAYRVFEPHDGSAVATIDVDEGRVALLDLAPSL